jgi:hypothetical protein
MSKGSSSNDDAIKLQRETLAESKIQNKELLKLLTAQRDEARTLKLPKLASPQPLPSTSTTDMIAQSQETRRNLQKRSGLLQTRMVMPQPSLPRTVLGGPLAA